MISAGAKHTQAAVNVVRISAFRSVASSVTTWGDSSAAKVPR